VNEPSEVEARFAADGSAAVRSFTWRGRRQTVVSQGRQWLAADGRHVLVMARGDRVFELLLNPATGAWQISSAPDPRRAA
jgi:hypothetical protein